MPVDKIVYFYIVFGVVIVMQFTRKSTEKSYKYVTLFPVASGISLLPFLMNAAVYRTETLYDR